MSLFGNFGQQNNQQNNQQQNPGTSSLFGASLNNNTNNNQPKPSLFGASTAQPQQNSFSLGGQQQQQQNQQQTQPQQQQQQQTGQQDPSPFGGLGNSAILNNARSMGASLLGGNSVSHQNFSQSAIGFSRSEMMPPQQKAIPEQMELIFRKWNPESPACTMHHYFYAAVAPERAPFVTMPADADERGWEEALRNKPYEGAVPVLAKGFQQLGSRLSMQVEAVKQLQMRSHEMNNSLGAMMEKHELVLSVRAAEAKRRHVGLSQRCLALAIKAQVLSSRGFVLDGMEEELKKKLAQLEKGVFDPAFAGREEEIWARMVALRERSRWLTEESEKLGKQVAGDNGLDDEVLKKTKKILNDYDAQLTHLKKELEQVKKEYEEWATASRPGSS